MSTDDLNDRLNRSALYIALLVAWVAMLGSLYFSEVKGYVPCPLCWYQRILMYPLAGLIAFGLLRFDNNLPYLVLPFSLIGMGFSTYHYLLEKTDLFTESAACMRGVPCTTAWINWFGFVTIPFLALSGFFLITIFTVVALVGGQPSAEEGARRPWLPVGGVIAAVIAFFAVLVYTTPESASTAILSQTSTTGQVPIATLLPVGTTPATDAAAVDHSAHITDGGSIAAGQQLYQQSCVGCHGADAQGIPNLGNPLVGSAIIAQPDAEVLAFINAGVDLNSPNNTTGLVMPPKGGRPDLSDEQILQIVSYLRSLQAD